MQADPTLGLGSPGFPSTSARPIRPRRPGPAAQARSDGTPGAAVCDVVGANYLGVSTSEDGYEGRSIIQWDGVLYPTSRVRVTDIADGTSQTLAVSERLFRHGQMTWARAVFRAADRPRFSGWWNTRTRESSAAHVSSTAAVPSDEPSFTHSASHAASVCRLSDSSARPTRSAPLNTGTTTDTSGVGAIAPFRAGREQEGIVSVHVRGVWSRVASTVRISRRDRGRERSSRSVPNAAGIVVPMSTVTDTARQARNLVAQKDAEARSVEP